MAAPSLPETGTEAQRHDASGPLMVDFRSQGAPRSIRPMEGSDWLIVQPYWAEPHAYSLLVPP